MNMTQGSACRALANNSRTACSLAPTQRVSNSGPLTPIKLALAWEATAFANKVLPVPGGPHSKIPLGAIALVCR